MKIPTLEGLIRRRLLINFRVDPTVMQKLLPDCFRPKLHRGHAIAGLCLIRLEHIRPAGVPTMFGLSSENAAHRVAVEWTTREGETREGVFIFRRDTDSALGQLAGGRIFPGVHHRGEFHITDVRGQIDFAMTPGKGDASIRLSGREADALPASSCFTSVVDSSKFFENGSLGYSPANKPRCFDGLRLETKAWKVQPFAVSFVESGWFNAITQKFPGCAEFDHALLMRDIPHRWHAAENLPGKETRSLNKLRHPERSPVRLEPNGTESKDLGSNPGRTPALQRVTEKHS